MIKPEPRLFFLSTNKAPSVITAHGNHQPTSLLSITRSTAARGYLITNPLAFSAFPAQKRDKQQTRERTTTADKLWLARQARLYSDRLLWLLFACACVEFLCRDQCWVTESYVFVMCLSATGQEERGRQTESEGGRNVTAAGSGYPTAVEPNNLLLFFLFSNPKSAVDLQHSNWNEWDRDNTFCREWHRF